MESKNLGHLPSEIIQDILKHLVKSYFIASYVEYQLFNRQWHLASKEVVYKALSLDESIDQYENFSRLESLIHFLQNPTHNMGQYVKQIHLFTESTVVWGTLLKYCPNLEEIYFRSQSESCTALWDYIVTAQEKSEKKLWRNMQALIIAESGNSLFRFYQLFRDSLRNLNLDMIPNVSNMYDNERAGREHDLYNYIGEFKQLEGLELHEGIIKHIFGCGLVARNSSASLVKLIVQLEDGGLTPTAMQSKDALTDDSSQFKNCGRQQLYSTRSLQGFHVPQEKVWKSGKTGIIFR